MAEPESLNTMFHDAFVKLGDGDYALKTANSVAPSTVFSISQTGTNNAVQSLLPTAARITSVTANGKVTAPAAAGAIATTPNLAAGTWDIEATVFIGGTTVAANEVDNTKFNIGATPVATIVCPVPGTAGALANSVFRARVQFGGATPVSVTVANAGTTGSVYVASLIATRVL